MYGLDRAILLRHIRVVYWLIIIEYWLHYIWYCKSAELYCNYSHIYIAIHKRGHGLNMVVIHIITHFMSYAYNSLAPLFVLCMGGRNRAGISEQNTMFEWGSARIVSYDWLLNLMNWPVGCGCCIVDKELPSTHWYLFRDTLLNLFGYLRRVWSD